MGKLGWMSGGVLNAIIELKGLVLSFVKREGAINSTIPLNLF